VCLDLSKA